MREQEIEEVLYRAWDQAVPEVPMHVVQRQVQLDGRAQRLDLLLRDSDGGLWACELKPKPLVADHVDQVLRYVEALGRTGIVARPMVMGPSARQSATRRAGEAGVAVHTFDEVRILELQRELGTRVVAPAYIKSEHVLLAIREPDELDRYWRRAYPGAADHLVATATEFAVLVIGSLPGAAMGWKAPGGWVCLTLATGDVIAAIEIGRDSVSVSFAITDDVVAEYRREGLGPVHQNRSIGKWVHVHRVNEPGRLTAAMTWFSRSAPAWAELRGLA